LSFEPSSNGGDDAEKIHENNHDTKYIEPTLSESYGEITTLQDFINTYIPYEMSEVVSDVPFSNVVTE